MSKNKKKQRLNNGEPKGTKPVTNQHQKPFHKNQQKQNNQKKPQEKKVFVDKKQHMQENELMVEMPDVIRKIEAELMEIDDKLELEVRSISYKYNEMKAPMFKRRDEELKNIKNFWSIVLSKHKTFCEILTQPDLEILNSLSSIDVSYSSNGAAVTMNFEENKFFEDKKLTVELEEGPEHLLVKSSTPANWKPGMKPTANSASPRKGDVMLFSIFLPNPDLEIGAVMFDMISTEVYPVAVELYFDEYDDDEESECDSHDVEEDSNDEESESD